MEGAVIGYAPYVQPSKSSSIPECYQDNSFMHLPRSESVPNSPISVEENDILNTASSDISDEQDSPVELTSNLNEDRKQRLSLKGRNSAMSCKSEIPGKKCASEVNSSGMSVVEENNSKTDLPLEPASVQNEDKRQRASVKRSSISMLELKPEQASQPKNPRETVRMASEEGSYTSLNDEETKENAGHDSLDKVCPETEITDVRLLGESGMAASASSTCASTATVESNKLSPDSPPLSTEGSDSSGKKRYLFDFKPNTHEIIVKNKSGEKSFKCYVCGGIYQQKFSLKRHYLRNHIDFRYISDNDISNCNIPVPFYMKELHSNLDYKKSSNGRKKFKKSNNDIFLETNDSCLMPGLYRCHDCPNITFDTENGLKDHYNKHPESIKKKFHCEVCDASFFKKQILSRHLASHGKKKERFECKKCNIDLPSQAELMRHSNSHSSGKMCKYCGKSLSTSANRKRHEALHLGLKPYNCTLCGSCFAQSKDLDRHLRKQHSELCRECPICTKLFPTAESLDHHVRDKHSESSSKKPETPNNLNTPEKENHSKLPAAAPSIPSAKPKSCTVCKRAFHTVYAMLKHKRQAHPYHSRKKKRVKQKVGRPKEVSSNLEFRKSYTKPQKTYDGHLESPAKRGRPIQKPPKYGERYVRRNGRSGPRSSVSKREEEAFKDYYRDVAYQINKNITQHIDGRAAQLSLKEYNFNDFHYSSGFVGPYSSKFFEEQERLPWSHYNFPQWYDVDNALKMRGQEIRRPEILSSKGEFLYDATGLAPNRPVDAESQSNNNNADQPVVNARERNEPMSLEEMKKLIGREVVTVLLCHVCKETFNSHEDYEQHAINNHPNVDCHFTAFEGDKEKPPVVPPEMRQTHLSPDGYRFSCDVPPSLNEGCMKCTKCRSEFPTRAELHNHLITCGDLFFSVPRHVRKNTANRRIKNTMKNRMSSAEQQATLDGNDYKTPEKRESKPNDSVGKGSKSTEKLQFYKSGRLQTTSLTVDMNYFSTKPTKPTKNVSKRGRKSFALVSSMYRNTNMQPSTSRECSDCRVVFPSTTALSQHLKSHCSEASTEKTDEINKIPRSASNKETENMPDSKRSSDSVNVNHIRSTSKELRMNAKVPANNTPELSRPHANVSLPSIPTLNSPPDAVRKDSSLRKAENAKNSVNSQSADGPIDLSTNSHDRNKTALPENSDRKISALQIAMDAVLRYSGDNEVEAKTRNLHISKLQETVEKLTPPVVSPLSKQAMPKKVGRPRKIKKDSSDTPLHLQEKCKSGLLGNSSLSKSKPVSKLEEAVERLKSKVSSQEKHRQSLVLTSSAVSAKSADVSLSAPQLEISDQKESGKSTVLQSNKEMPDNITASSPKTSESTAADDSKSNISSVSDTCSPSKDDSALKVKTENNNVASAASEETALGIVVSENIVADKNQQIQKINFEGKGDVQDLSTLPSSEFSLPERSEKVNQSSHGRSSPTFDSLLKVINQKLHSEEEESSQHDDTDIPWLEDDKFLIPPSRSNLNIIVKSSANVELVPVENNRPDINISKSDLDLRSSISPGNSEAKEISTVASDSSDLDSKIAEKSLPPVVTPKKVTFTSGTNGIQISPKGQAKVNKEIPKIPETIVSDSGVSNQGTVTIKSPQKSSSPKTTSKELKTSSEDRPPARRGPGRPRKRLLNSVDTIVQSKTRKSTTSADLSAVTPVNPVEKNIVPDVAPLNGGDASNETVSSVDSTNKESDLSQDILKRSNETLSAKCTENDAQSSTLSNSDEVDNASQSEQPAISLRTFRTKAKQTQGDTNEKPNFSLKNNITTAFGKSLASKMKEKMRLSSEQDSSKTAAKTDEPIASTSSACDANSQPKEKLKIVKKECDTAELTKIHSCPYCMLEFAYLTNFRRHLNACLARTEINEAESAPGNSTTNLQHLPKKDEVDYSMLNLYRHQSRQTQMLKEVEKNLGSDTPIKKYECTVCHRIYLNLFTFLQHKITQHNLAPQSSGEVNASSDSPNCPNEINAIASTSHSTQQENGLNLEENVSYESLVDNFMSEHSNESAVDDPPVSEFKEVANQVDDSISETKSCTPELKESDGLLKETEVDIPEDLPEDSNESESVKDEKIPVKRKRGRPFGWRKNINMAEGNKNIPELKKEIHATNKNSSVISKRAGRPSSSSNEASLLSKLKAKTKKVILNKLEKTVPRTKSAALEESQSVDTESVNDKKEMKLEKSDTPQFSSVVKDLPKASIIDGSLMASDDFQDFKTEKYSKSSLKTKNTSPIERDSKNKVMKRGRGRPPVLPAIVSKTPTAEPELPIKRRPGRPPKNIQSAAGPSQPVKHTDNSLPARSGRKTVPIAVDSSDSECEVVKADIPVKKKIRKICAVCKKKFLSTLALHRHIQILHSRRTQLSTSASKTEPPIKVSKKASPKSPVLETSEDDDIAVKQSDDTAAKKSTHLKNCPICKAKFSSGTQLRDHLQNFHSRKSEPIAIKPKPPTETSDSDSNRSVAIKNKKVESPNRNSLSRQCRKSLPLVQKRLKKQSPEQVKKQKL